MNHTPGPWQPSEFIDHSQYSQMSKGWKQQRKQEEQFTIRGPGIIGEGSCNPIANVLTMNSADVHLIAAAPAMYEALSDAEGMWNIARLIDSKHHAGNPISNDLWSDFHQYLMEWHAKRKDALAQAEGKP